VIDPRRRLPSVERTLVSLANDVPHVLRAQAAREAVDAARARVERGEVVSGDDVVAEAHARLDAQRQRMLRPVVNATGVLLHTNLGRAPLGRSTREAMSSVSGYSNLEYRLREGVRGSRHEHAGHLLAAACGAEAGIVVNNNAAAVLLVLATLARGREVVVSRGELVEIGGGFRVPEILAETGARLVEVGTTNRTRRSDYELAVNERTALLLKVHASNYRMVGFVESATVGELADVGPPVVVDAGSGLLDDTAPWLPTRPVWLRDELGVRQSLAAGAALVTFSGDKLLGGPQAGVIVGRGDLVDRCKMQPLARAVRADKATVPLDALRTRAERVAASVPGAKLVDTSAVAGGGSLPGLEIPSVGIAVEVAAPQDAAARLRGAGVVARIEEGRIVCDLRSVDAEDDRRLVAALREALA
jgi:L-seryl-tRNA(Ser) seleniumtransferase